MDNMEPRIEVIIVVGRGGEERLKSLFEEESAPINGAQLSGGGGLKALIEPLQHHLTKLKIMNPQYMCA